MKRTPNKQQASTKINLPETGNDERISARYVGCSPRLLAELRLRSRGRLDRLGPRYYTVGRLIRYKKSDLDKFIEGRRGTPAA